MYFLCWSVGHCFIPFYRIEIANLRNLSETFTLHNINLEEIKMCLILGKLLLETVKHDSVTYTCPVNGSHEECFLLGDDKEPLQVLIERLQKAVSEECHYISEVNCYFNGSFGQEVPESKLLLIG